jgi:Rod binding domain-containing protein
MSSLVNTIPSGSGRSSIEQLKRPTNGTIEAEKARLRKATEEFESFFVYQMLKTMRETIPDGGLAGDGPLSGSLGKETFTDLFDMEIARSVSFGGNSSISDLLYGSMEKLIDAKFETAQPVVGLKELSEPKSAPIEIESSDPVPLPDPEPEFREVDRPGTPLPLRTVFQPIDTDPITARFGKLIDEAAAETELDSTLISAVIQAESSGNPRAVSPSGAKGLMQLMDSTARDLKVTDSFDPGQNIRGGSRYLRSLLDRFGKLDLALAAYNAGPGNVEKHGGLPPFEETRAYVRRVTDLVAAARDK